ncbi:MAG: pyrimidine dimer DNA glycosylase/endonuclease V [Candidatus Edwardsbacteria bacterium]|nr:pyrimidine dimer DNA glycosylase/endonuclease V [Candidatus Edwardsbacteria bacterium]
MRLWSLHPKYLDRQGLLAVWREGLLAQKVLQGGTRGYNNHPQLQRFREQKDPLAAIGAYLFEVHEESAARGYRFDGRKISSKRKAPKIKVASGQVEYELRHLLKKLKKRDVRRYISLRSDKNIQTHILFKVIKGPVEGWERAKKSLHYISF